MKTVRPIAITGKRMQAKSHGATRRAPTRSTVEYEAMIAPVASAHGTAASSAWPPRRTRQGCWAAMMPTRSAATPIVATTLVRSPRSTTPVSTVSSGALPRAMG